MLPLYFEPKTCKTNKQTNKQTNKKKTLNHKQFNHVLLECVWEGFWNTIIEYKDAKNTF